MIFNLFLTVFALSDQFLEYGNSDEFLKILIVSKTLVFKVLFILHNFKGRFSTF